jgi:hypothetical protein
VRALVRNIAKVAFILVFSATWIFGAWPQVFEFPQKTSDALAQTPPWYNEDWQYRNEFTIDAAKVAGAATSFPVLINSTREEWRDTSHSGNVGSTTGWDFVFAPLVVLCSTRRLGYVVATG